MILAIAALRNLEVRQMDVKTAFLNRVLDEEIYMEQPKGFSAPGQEKKVCRLVKSIYGLKQAPKQWHKKFDQAMMANGFRINECDNVFMSRTLKMAMLFCVFTLMTCSLSVVMIT